MTNLSGLCVGLCQQNGSGIVLFLTKEKGYYGYQGGASFYNLKRSNKKIKKNAPYVERKKIVRIIILL
jgi:hypothetical protein